MGCDGKPTPSKRDESVRREGGGHDELEIVHNEMTSYGIFSQIADTDHHLCLQRKTQKFKFQKKAEVKGSHIPGGC